MTGADPGVGARIAGALVEHLGTEPDTAAPYLTHELPGHLGQSGSWELLADQTDLLDRLDPTSLASAGHRFRATNPPVEVLASMAALERLRETPVSRRRARPHRRPPAPHRTARPWRWRGRR